ncbi:hypothetical protein AB0C10_36645 [Microbispora amethystogenes]
MSWHRGIGVVLFCCFVVGAVWPFGDRDLGWSLIAVVGAWLTVHVMRRT